MKSEWIGDDGLHYLFIDGYLNGPDVAECPRISNNVELGPTTTQTYWNGTSYVTMDLPDYSDLTRTATTQDSDDGHSYEIWSFMGRGTHIDGRTIADDFSRPGNAPSYGQRITLDSTPTPSQVYIMLDGDDRVGVAGNINNWPQGIDNHDQDIGLGFVDGHVVLARQDVYVELSLRGYHPFLGGSST